MIMAQAAGMLQMFGIVLAFFGDSLFRMVGIPTPTWWAAMQEGQVAKRLWRAP